MTLQHFRAVLRSLDGFAMAALLHELGFELYARDIAQWRALPALADEIVSSATLRAKVTMAARVTEAAAKSGRARRQRRRRRPD